MGAQSSLVSITGLLGHPVKMPIRLFSTLSASRPAGDTKARCQYTQFSARMGRGRGVKTCAVVLYVQGSYPTENILYDLGERLVVFR